MIWVRHRPNSVRSIFSMSVLSKFSFSPFSAAVRRQWHVASTTSWVIREQGCLSEDMATGSFGTWPIQTIIDDDFREEQYLRNRCPKWVWMQRSVGHFWIQQHRLDSSTASLSVRMSPRSSYTHSIYRVQSRESWPHNTAIKVLIKIKVIMTGQRTHFTIVLKAATSPTVASFGMSPVKSCSLGFITWTKQLTFQWCPQRIAPCLFSGEKRGDSSRGNSWRPFVSLLRARGYWSSCYNCTGNRIPRSRNNRNTTSGTETWCSYMVFAGGCCHHALRP